MYSLEWILFYFTEFLLFLFSVLTGPNCMVLCAVPPMTLSGGTQMLSLETESADWTGCFLLEQCPAKSPYFACPSKCEGDPASATNSSTGIAADMFKPIC